MFLIKLNSFVDEILHGLTNQERKGKRVLLLSSIPLEQKPTRAVTLEDTFQWISSLSKKKFEEKRYLKENTPLLEAIRDKYSEHVATADKKIIHAENHGFKIAHIYSTQRIEGSPITLGQTRNLPEYNLLPKGIELEHLLARGGADEENI